MQMIRQDHHRLDPKRMPLTHGTEGGPQSINALDLQPISLPLGEVHRKEPSGSRHLSATIVGH